MTIKRTRWLGLVLALVTSVALLTPGSALALPVNPPKIGMVCLTGPTFNLVATTGYIQTPDSNSIFMWSYADSSGLFQSPGPVLCVTQGDTVTVNLTNNLSEASSIVFPGQEGVTATGGSAGLLTTEAAALGGTVTYTFTASQPGTYLYQSGSDVSKQVEMGLYGALVVRPNTTTCPVVVGSDCAYNATTRFDPKREYMLLLAEVDPDLHHAVETGGAYDFNALHNRYFTINGRSFPDTIQDNGSPLLPTQPYGALVRLQPTNGSSQPTLIRMLNAGALNHPFHPHGNHTREIAQDGRPILTAGSDASTEHFGETIGSGQTLDYLIRWDNQTTDTSGASFNDNWNPNTNQLPVPQPNYRNLTFKDGNTWYAGNPYLGYKGTLPTGVLSQNICGEWYFPFHSHALDEFSNFDVGFGGMGTLLRVDPLGGCFTFPSSTKITVGTLNGGTVTNLSINDGAYYKVNSTTSTTDWYGQLSGVPAGAANLKVTYIGNNIAPTYTQNFNTLASTGTSTTLPAGWALSETGTGANTSYTANNGSSTTANTYSYGATGNTDRAFGGLRGAVNPTIGAQFTNTTGVTITSLSISYTGEQWRLGQNGGGRPQDRLDFQLSTNATSLTTGTWTDYNSLDFNSPVVAGTVGPLNGNVAPNRTALGFTITGLTIPNGATYWIRWQDFDLLSGTGADDGLAVDDFSLTPHSSPGPDTTVSIWNWATSTWTPLAGSTPVGETDVTVANNVLVAAAPVPGSWASYVGTGANKGLVRVRVLSTLGGTASFITGGNFMSLVYDAP